jgi:hypothetical protein
MGLVFMAKKAVSCCVARSISTGTGPMGNGDEALSACKGKPSGSNGRVFKAVPA